MLPRVVPHGLTPYGPVDRHAAPPLGRPVRRPSLARPPTSVAPRQVGLLQYSARRNGNATYTGPPPFRPGVAVRRDGDPAPRGRLPSPPVGPPVACRNAHAHAARPVRPPLRARPAPSFRHIGLLQKYPALRRPCPHVRPFFVVGHIDVAGPLGARRPRPPVPPRPASPTPRHNGMPAFAARPPLLPAAPVITDPSPDSPYPLGLRTFSLGRACRLGRKGPRYRPVPLPRRNVKHV